jgi:hypothetical protein
MARWKSGDFGEGSADIVNEGEGSLLRNPCLLKPLTLVTSSAHGSMSNGKGDCGASHEINISSVMMSLVSLSGDGLHLQVNTGN